MTCRLPFRAWVDVTELGHFSETKRLATFPIGPKTRISGNLRAGSKINWVFWRGEDKAAKEGEAGILLDLA
jgi:hypothetical protein